MMQQYQPQLLPVPPRERQRERGKPERETDYGVGGPFSLKALMLAMDMVDDQMIAFEEAMEASEALTPKQREQERAAFEMVRAIEDPDVFPAAREWFQAQYQIEGWDRQMALHLRRMERDSGRPLG